MSAGIDVFGVDFTSRPSRRKPITRARARLCGSVLSVSGVDALTDYQAFDDTLALPGPWVAGMDFPFGQSRRLVRNLGWPLTWCGYIARVAALERAAFVAALEAYKAPRASGDREHPRGVDARAGSISPQKLYGVPVGKMFFEGAPRLWRSGVHVVPVRPREDPRIVVEAYPSLVARRFVGRRSYKNDSRARQTLALRRTRKQLLDALRGGGSEEVYGVTLDLRRGLVSALVDDPGADRLDAVLCAIQAAWSWERRDSGFGVPPGADRLEGWIVDPGLL